MQTKVWIFVAISIYLYDENKGPMLSYINSLKANLCIIPEHIRKILWFV